MLIEQSEGIGSLGVGEMMRDHPPGCDLAARQQVDRALGRFAAVRVRRRAAQETTALDGARIKGQGRIFVQANHVQQAPRGHHPLRLGERLGSAAATHGIHDHIGTLTHG